MQIKWLPVLLTNKVCMYGRHIRLGHVGRSVLHPRSFFHDHFTYFPHVRAMFNVFVYQTFVPMSIYSFPLLSGLQATIFEICLLKISHQSK